MDKFWNKFIERYANDPFYWYQPKGFTVSSKNILLIQKKLNLLKAFNGNPWRESQVGYTKLLQREGLFEPRKAKRGSLDYAAIVRMNKEVFDSLGLVWVNEDSIMEITDAGREFMRLKGKELNSFVSTQLSRYMYPNPAVG